MALWKQLAYPLRGLLKKGRRLGMVIPNLGGIWSVMDTALMYLGILILATVVAACVVGVIEVIQSIVKGE